MTGGRSLPSCTNCRMASNLPCSLLTNESFCSMSVLTPEFDPGFPTVTSTGLRRIDSLSERTVGVTVAENSPRTAVEGTSLRMASIWAKNVFVCVDPDCVASPCSSSPSLSAFLLLYLPFAFIIPSAASNNRSASSNTTIRTELRLRPFSMESTSRSGVETRTSIPFFPPADPDSTLAALALLRSIADKPPIFPAPSRSTSR
mmetsp:Transcript_851/g.1704  ORF Transcript_851/g.1704 Transcript_851/m.1704 type:complete len:202 (-) Transcript_851:733-1338(-)